MNQDQHVVITTKHGLVMQGRLQHQDGTTVTLAGARCCLYWSKDVRGVFGLAATGPDSDCRVGRAVPIITLYDVTSISVCTDAAVQAWAGEPWKG